MMSMRILLFALCLHYNMNIGHCSNYTETRARGASKILLFYLYPLNIQVTNVTIFLIDAFRHGLF